MRTQERRADSALDIMQLADLLRIELIELLRAPGPFEYIVRRDQAGIVTFPSYTHS